MKNMVMPTSLLCSDYFVNLFIDLSIYIYLSVSVWRLSKVGVYTVIYVQYGVG
jgi:hypothetical protein